MTNKKPQPDNDAQRLERQIKRDQQKHAPAEKPLKIHNPKGFKDTLKKIVKKDTRSS